MQFNVTFLSRFAGVCFILVTHNAIAQFTDMSEDEASLEAQFGNEEVVSIATGAKQTLRKAPAVASVITAKMIAQMGATDIDEVLETVPGLHVSYNHNGYNPIYNFRGMHTSLNPQVLMLINGVPLTELYVGNRGQSWGGMPVAAISRIEVIRGPGSALYGADAFAGVINIITKNPQELKGTSITARAASYNTRDISFLHGTQWGDFNVGFVLEYHKTDGYDGTVNSDAQTVLDSVFDTNVSNAPGELSLSRDNLDLRFELSKDNWVLRSGLQKRSDWGNAAGVVEALDPTSRYGSDRFTLDYNWKKTLKNNINVEFYASHLSTSLEVEEDLIIFPAGTNIGFGVLPDGLIGNPEVFERHDRLGISAAYNGFEQHKIRAGFGYYKGNIHRTRETKNFGLDPVTREPLPAGAELVDVTDTDLVFLQEGYRENQYAFIQDVWTFSRDWELTLGVRHDHFSDFGSTTNPRAALVWSKSHDLTIKFLYGRAFRAPSFAETRAVANPVVLGNPELNPERLTSYEVAFDYRPSDKVTFLFNIYQYRWTDIIEFIPDEGAPTSTANNSARQDGNGFESELTWSPSSSLSLSANFSYSDATRPMLNEGAVGSSDIRQAFSPQRQLFIKGTYHFSDTLYGYLQMNQVMDRAREQGDTRNDIDDYTQVDTSFGYKSINGDWALRASILNIFNEDIRVPSVWSNTFANIPDDLPQPDRRFRLDVTFNF